MTKPYFYLDGECEYYIFMYLFYITVKLIFICGLFWTITILFFNLIIQILHITQKTPLLSKSTADTIGIFYLFSC